jgi:DNA repair protein RadC
MKPREKLLQLGAAGLTDAELLAVLLQTGTARANVMSVADQLLKQLGGLPAVLSAPFVQISKTLGVGLAKYSILQAASEISRRTARNELDKQPMVQPLDLSPWLTAHLSGLPHEVFGAAFLDSRHRLLGIENLFRGSLTQTSVYPREIVARALQLNAAKVVVFHNHPSGVAEPSYADQQLTARLRGLLAQLDLVLWDHLLVAGDRVLSIGQQV